MLSLYSPLLSLLAGTVLGLYGLAQTLLYRPEVSAFQAFIEHLPILASVTVFFLGLLAVISGFSLVLYGWRRLFRLPPRPRPIPSSNNHNPYDDEDSVFFDAPMREARW